MRMRFGGRATGGECGGGERESISRAAPTNTSGLATTVLTQMQQLEPLEQIQGLFFRPEQSFNLAETCQSALRFSSLKSLKLLLLHALRQLFQAFR
jgi:hypothetical protein